MTTPTSADLSPSVTPSALAAPRLPVQLTSFVGREREVDALLELLQSARLLTITGAGGSGKTRLALEVAARGAASHTDGVAWIELASLVESRFLPTHVALALGIHEDAARTPEEAIVATLRERSLLLVLDNCEHLVDACAALADTLLRNCATLRILATSREALGVGGERSWLVPMLSLPPAVEAGQLEAAARAEAVRLFVTRAQDVLPSFALTDHNVGAVSRICRRVDGLPLAVELAAARVRVLAPEQIAARLEDSFRLLATTGRGMLPRHRTLRAAIDWSCSLLDAPERRLFERLSVFSGGFTLEAAERICAGGPIAEQDVLDLIAELVDKSLVAMQEESGVGRYRLLEVVRQYAAEMLRADDSATTAVQRRHAEYFRDLALAAEPHLIVADPGWLRRLDAELDNCRAAIAWSESTNERAMNERTSVGLPLVTSLIWYWYHRLLWREGARVLESALAAAQDAPPELRGKTLHGTAIFATYVGDLQLADERLAAAEQIWRTTGNDRWLAFTLIVMTTVALATGRPDAAEAYAEESVRVARRTGEPWDAALASGYALMAVKVWREDWLSADALLADAERIFRTRHYSYGLGFVLDARAYVALQLGEDERAATLAAAALREIADRPDHWLASRSARILSAIEARGARLETAATLLGVADGLLSAIGVRALTTERAGVAEVGDALRERMTGDAFERAYAAGHAMGFRDALAYALGYAHSPTPASWKLDVRALGALEIFLDGTRLGNDGWRYAKPREVLLYLLANRSGRTREQVGLAFWPDASASQVKNNFHVTLHHMRKTLGRADVIIFADDRYVVNRALGISFDAARFEDEGSAALRHRGPAAIPVLEGAIALYRGDFLEDAGAGDWHLEHRDRLRRLFVDLSLALGAALTDVDRHRDAAAAYQALVAREELHEEAVRRLMTSLARAGERGEALRRYERLATLLRAELEAEPESTTTALAERIRRAVF